MEEININGENHQINLTQPEIANGQVKQRVTISLSNSEEYKILIKRSKILCKKTNPDKRFFTPVIINNIAVSLMMPDGMNVDLHRMGTVKEFVKEEEQVNLSTRLKSWSYKGLILPHQGYIMIFR